MGCDFGDGGGDLDRELLGVRVKYRKRNSWNRIRRRIKVRWIGVRWDKNDLIVDLRVGDLGCSFTPSGSVDGWSEIGSDIIGF